MIRIENKQDCCGCAACVQRCPKQCISMREDEEGFLYPQVDVERCIECGLCEKVCPVINQNEPQNPKTTYAVKNPNEKIRKESSSGGVFTMLAERIIDEGGVVFGVGYNEHWEAAHYYTETKEGLSVFRGSKYVQSIVGNTFKEAEQFLKQGRKVLYSGTPCQIAGLKRYLRKEYDNLLAIDSVCHGTPSPGVFRWYLTDKIAKIATGKNRGYQCPIPQIPKGDDFAREYGVEIKGIRFRDKSCGWRNYRVAFDFLRDKNQLMIYSQSHYQDSFMKGFLRDLYLRPSCHACPARQLKSGSDITLGDWWGIWVVKPDFYDDLGISAVVVNSEKGMLVLQGMEQLLYPMEYEDLCKYNPALLKSSKCPPLHEAFFAVSKKGFDKRIADLTNVSLMIRVINKLKRVVRNVCRRKA